MESIACPLCGGEITKRQFDQIQKKLETEIETRLKGKLQSEREQLANDRTVLAKERETITTRLAGLDEEVAERVQRQLAKQKQSIVEQAVKDKEVELKAAKQRVSEYEEREAKLLAREGDLAQRERLMESQVTQRVNQRLAGERERIREEVSQAEVEKTRVLSVKVNVLEGKLKEHQSKELQLIERETVLDERERTINLQVNQRLSEERKRIQTETTKTIGEEYRLQLQEKDHLITDLQRDLEDAQRKAAQGSAQMRGELEEEDLEVELKRLCPLDAIEPIVQGKPGADILQTVRDRLGRVCGSILWESKQTKTWSDGWLPKLRVDQRNVKADLAVLVSHALPADISSFANRDGVLITKREYVPSIAPLLRNFLIQIAHTKATEEQKEQKAAELYGYVTSKEFLQKIQGIVDGELQLHKLQEQEQRAHESLWSKRSKLQTLIVKQVAQLYGEVSTLVGGLPAIKELEFPLLEEPPSLLEVKEPVSVEQSDVPF